MVSKSKIKDIKKLVGANAFDQAFTEMEALPSEEIENAVLLYKRQVIENKKQFGLGLKDLEKFNVKNARISLAILELLDQLIPNVKIDLAEQYLKIGKQRIEEQDFLSAKVYFDKALLEDSTLLEAYFDRGVSKLSLGYYQDAVNDFSIVIKKNPNDAIAHYNQGVALFQLGRTEDACRNWKKVNSLGFDIASDALQLCT